MRKNIFTQIRKQLIFTAFISGFLLMAFTSGSKYQINLRFSDVKDTTIYLANYFGNKVLRVDSVRLSHNGEAVFSGKEPLKPGIYLVYLNDKNYFEFLIDKVQDISIVANFQKPTENKYIGSDDTQRFQQYQKFLASQRDKQINLQNQLTVHAQISDSLKIIRQKLVSLNTEMERYWAEQSEKYSGSLYADFLHSMIIPQLPEFELPTETKNIDSLKWVMQYNYINDHYWDSFNFAQPGLIRTPIIDGKLDNYFKNTLLQIPDSMIRPMINVVEKSKINDEMYQYNLLYLLNLTNQSEIMGMDKAFVTLSEKYVLNGDAAWIDSITQAKIRERVMVTKPNMIGNAAPELKLPDSEGNYYSLRQMNGPYTILYFWEPDCGHCKKSTPLLYNSLYLKLKDEGVDIFAVCTQNDKEKWMKAIQEYGIHDWTNVWDPMNQSKFRILYDVTTTPVIYILDKEKKIIAKRIDVETALKFLENIISK